MEAAIDFSIWALFSRATLPVQAVIVLLIGLSIWSWTIAINKRIALNLARRRSAKFDKAFWSGEPLDGLFDKIGAAPKGGSELIFTAGMTEWQRSHRSDGVLIAGAQSRIERSMDVALAKQSNDLQSGLAILASIGSVAPFIGLTSRWPTMTTSPPTTRRPMTPPTQPSSADRRHLPPISR